MCNKDANNNDNDDPPAKKRNANAKAMPKTNKKCKKKSNNDNNNNEFSHDNYNTIKPHLYHLEYNDDDKSYEYIQIDISGAIRHAVELSLSRGINPIVDNLNNITFPDFLLDNIDVESNAYSVSNTILPKYIRKADNDGLFTTP